MHAALVSRLLKDRSAWELAHVPVASESAPVEEMVPAGANAILGSPALMGA
jgi:hypothetical protein